MADPRIAEYAQLLVDRCVGVQPGWQVKVSASPLARPLVEEVVRQIARHGAYALVRLIFSQPLDATWAALAPVELLERPAPVALHEADSIDAWITIHAPENAKALTALDDDRMASLRKGIEPTVRRTRTMEIPWVICEYPVPALAQESGMATDAFADFLYGACLLDWDERGREMERIRERFDRAETVRIVGEGTDLTLGLAGRNGLVDDGHVNMPGGEVFYGPLEDATEGVITYSEFPAVYVSHEVHGARLVFREGRVVEASAESGEDFLIHTLDTDEGARRVGELGIGCNPGITRHMKNTLFDEKIYGTIHLAVGNSYTMSGGVNESVVHWDMVKDLRTGGQIYCDGELVQESGQWRF